MLCRLEDTGIWLLWKRNRLIKTIVWPCSRLYSPGSARIDETTPVLSLMTKNRPNCRPHCTKMRGVVFCHEVITAAYLHISQHIHPCFKFTYASTLRDKAQHQNQNRNRTPHIHLHREHTQTYTTLKRSSPFLSPLIYPHYTKLKTITSGPKDRP